MSLFFYIHSLHETLILSFFVTCMNIQSLFMKQINLSQFENAIICLCLAGINQFFTASCLQQPLLSSVVMDRLSLLTKQIGNDISSLQKVVIRLQKHISTQFSPFLQCFFVWPLSSTCHFCTDCHIVFVSLVKMSLVISLQSIILSLDASQQPSNFQVALRLILPSATLIFPLFSIKAQAVSGRTTTTNSVHQEQQRIHWACMFQILSFSATHLVVLSDSASVEFPC